MPGACRGLHAGNPLLASWEWKYQRASYSRREAVGSSFLRKHSLPPGRTSAHCGSSDPLLFLTHPVTHLLGSSTTAPLLGKPQLSTPWKQMANVPAELSIGRLESPHWAETGRWPRTQPLVLPAISVASSPVCSDLLGHILQPCDWQGGRVCRPALAQKGQRLVDRPGGLRPLVPPVQGCRTRRSWI